MNISKNNIYFNIMTISSMMNWNIYVAENKVSGLPLNFSLFDVKQAICTLIEIFIISIRWKIGVFTSNR